MIWVGPINLNFPHLPHVSTQATWRAHGDFADYYASCPTCQWRSPYSQGIALTAAREAHEHNLKYHTVSDTLWDWGMT